MNNTHEVIEAATEHLQQLSGHVFDLLTVSKPVSPEAAVNLAKVVSKLSPLLGNLIEFNSVEFLNRQPEYKEKGLWKRQDPGFPDTVFVGDIQPTPGFEIKAWFPLATEITARFKDSQNHFIDDQTYVCLLAWLPEFLFFGKPQIIDVCVVSGMSVAQARDAHYHNPPDYLVIEPGDTSGRTQNLQQTNTNGYKWQGDSKQFADAQRLVDSWGNSSLIYEPTVEYQNKVQELIGSYPYRLDTNFAKMNRISHEGINRFKRKVLNSTHHGLTVKEWGKLLGQGKDAELRAALLKQFDIREGEADNI